MKKLFSALSHLRGKGYKAHHGKKATRFGIFFSLIEALPLFAVITLTFFGIFLVTLLLFDSFYTGLLWTSAAAAAVLGALVCRYTHFERPGSIREGRFFDIAVLILVAAWMLGNMLYTYQHVRTDRDPATYAVAGMWLTEESSVKIPHSMEFSDVEGLTQSSAGFHTGPEKEAIYTQGQHLLPALLGFAGRIVGEHHLLHINPVFGATALLAIYAFGRLLMRPRWAALAAVAVGTSLPLIYFSRDTYTEPLAATFTFGSLALIWIAQSAKKSVPWLWLVAGLVSGASVLTRIDAYLVILALVLFAFIYLMIANKKQRKERLVAVALFLLGMAMPSIIGWLDTYLLSPYYYEGHVHLINMELAAIALALAVGTIATIICWKTKILSFLDKVTKKWRSWAIIVAFAGISVFFVSRPLWYVDFGDSLNTVVEHLQTLYGYAIEPRFYGELSVAWVAWYIGATTLFLGVIGLAVATVNIFNKRGALMLAVVLVTLSTSLLYFYAPNITPDQIWAIRRFLPIVIPAMVIFAAYLFDWFSIRAKLSQYMEWGVYGVVAIVFLAGTINTTMPFIFLRERTQLKTVSKVCENLPSNAAIIWTGFAKDELMIPPRALCGLPTAGSRTDALNKNHLESAARKLEKEGKELYVGVYGNQMAIIDVYNQDTSTMTLVVKNQYYNMEQTLLSVPKSTVEVTEEVFLGRVSTDGVITPLEGEVK